MIAFLPLSEIFADYSWNIRSIKSVHENESDAVRDSDTNVPQGRGLEGLAQNIAQRGQDMPVIVRKVVNGMSLGGDMIAQPYELVAGFRRYTAISKLTAVPGVPIGCIKAECRELSQTEARLLNCRENTDRRNLTTDELVRAVGTLIAEGLTYEEISNELSIALHYVGRLAVVSRLPGPVLAHWSGKMKLPGREGLVDRKLSVVDLVSLEKQAQKESLLPHQILERYTIMLTPDPRPHLSRNTSGALVKRVHAAGTLAGELVRAGILLPGSLDWSQIIGYGLPIDIGPSETAQKFLEVAEGAFEAARVGKTKEYEP
jgi:ParB-like chromosome segregation protein Spo0J